jgi:hypothetical protein
MKTLRMWDHNPITIDMPYLLPLLYIKFIELANHGLSTFFETSSHLFMSRRATRGTCHVCTNLILSLVVVVVVVVVLIFGLFLGDHVAFSV